jgi:hypothetical protein
MIFEQRGIPSATFVTHSFETYARGLCRMQGWQALPLIVIPHPIAARPQDELRAKVRKVRDQFIAALVGQA